MPDFPRQLTPLVQKEVEPASACPLVRFNDKTVANVWFRTAWGTAVDVIHEALRLGASVVEVRMPDIVEKQHSEMYGNMTIAYRHENHAIGREIEFDCIHKDAIHMLKISD